MNDTTKTNPVGTSIGSQLKTDLGTALTGGLSSGISGALGSMFTMPFQYLFDSLSAERQLRHDKQRMSHQADLNREQYDYERRMESPAMERARLESAGLNPALMYGGGAQGGMNSGITGTSISSTPSAPSSISRISPGDLAQARLADSQSKHIDAQANRENAQADYYRSLTPTDGKNLGDVKYDQLWAEANRAQWQAGLFASQTESERSRKISLDFQNMFNEWKLPYDKQKVEYSVDKSEYELLGLIQQFEHKENMNPVELQLAKAQLQVHISNLMTAEIQRYLMEHQVYKTQAEISEIMAKEPYWTALAEQLTASAELTRAQTKTERSMRGFRQAKAVMDMINQTVNTGIRGFSAWSTFGVSEAFRSGD